MLVLPKLLVLLSVSLVCSVTADKNLPFSFLTHYPNTPQHPHTEVMDHHDDMRLEILADIIRLQSSGISHTVV